MRRHNVMSVALRREQDVVLARHRARQLSQALGFGHQDQIRIATAVSEMARNAFRYARDGVVRFFVEGELFDQMLVICVEDSGPGIPHLQDVLDGVYRSETGMGEGIRGARTLMDGFDVTSTPSGTQVHMMRRLPRSASEVTGPAIVRILDTITSPDSSPAFTEFQLQNQELLRVLQELEARNEELVRMGAELEDTNRGVVALYMELEDRAEQLRRANTLKAQFMSYMSHEFRTPLDSMIALAGILIDRVDGDLGAEQEHQVSLIRKSARDLLTMVDDLLDTARVDAGQISLRPRSFLIGDLFSALRATLRPLTITDDTLLLFEDPPRLPPFNTDEGRVSQILRNLISNALKFTEGGVVRVTAECLDAERVALRVEDTGIGIPPEQVERIFLDFTQVDTPLQRRVRGTGLGLPLSRRLATVLGGSLEVQSTPGVGSTFTLIIPFELPASEDGAVTTKSEPPRERRDATHVE